MDASIDDYKVDKKRHPWIKPHQNFMGDFGCWVWNLRNEEHSSHERLTLTKRRTVRRVRTQPKLRTGIFNWTVNLRPFYPLRILAQLPSELVGIATTKVTMEGEKDQRTSLFEVGINSKPWVRSSNIWFTTFDIKGNSSCLFTRTR